MSDRLKRSISTITIIVLLCIIAVVGVIFFKNYKKVKTLEVGGNENVLSAEEQESQNAAYWETAEVPEDLKDVGSIHDIDLSNQPEGFGVKRPLTVDQSMIVDAGGEGGVGSINFDTEFVSGDKKSGVVKGKYSDSEKRQIVDSIEEDKNEGKVICHVNWSRSNELSDMQYKTLCVAAGKVMENSLNGNSGLGRYSVIADVPTVKMLNEVGIETFYEMDEFGYLSLAIDVTVQDLQEETEIERIGVYTLYYDQNYLTIKEGSFIQ